MSATGNAGESEEKGGTTVSLNVLRGQALQRLAGIHERLEARGVGAAFLRAAKADPMGDMGFLSSVIFHAILGGPWADMLSDICPFSLSHGFNYAAGGMAAAEGIALARDVDVQEKRARRMSFYPEGRRKLAMKEAKMSRKFNLISANQNTRFSFDVQSEMACMFEIIDMLDKLEQQGVQEIRIDGKGAVYGLLQRVTQARGRGIEKGQPAPLKVAI